MTVGSAPTRGTDRSVPGAVRVNDVALKIATVNGTGSSSVNTLLLRAIFRMGIPVSGKNLFPSNIQGLPTWYEIRAHGAGHTARAPQYDVMVALNAQTYAEDIAEVAPGGWVLHDSTWPLPDDVLRADVTFLGVPFTRLAQQGSSAARERILLTNTCYAGVLVALLDIDLGIVRELLDEIFARKARLREANHLALSTGYDYAREHFAAPLPVRLETMGAAEGKILVDGNTATALGCLYAGATVAAWYPITPSTSVLDSFAALCLQYRQEPVGEPGPDGEVEHRNRYLVLQAEDELAAIGMVLGASWNGARAFTATSGPGISLMSELLGLAYFAEIPAVLVDVQRAGPSTGMPTRTQQADLLACAYASHGDTKHLLLIPAHPGECFEFAVRAFDLAERFQTPVILLSDLDIGMNDWVVDELTWDDTYLPDRGRVLGPQDLDAMTRFSRYAGEDADFVTPRTLPGVDPRGAYFLRGSGHDKHAAYTERAEEYLQVMDRLASKHAAAAAHVPAPVVERRDGATCGIVSIGSCDLAVREALSVLAERGLAVDYLRVRGFPFAPAVRDFLDEHEVCFVVEQNRDAQLRTLLTAEAGGSTERLLPVLSYGGLPISAGLIVDAVARELEN